MRLSQMDDAGGRRCAQKELEMDRMKTSYLILLLTLIFALTLSSCSTAQPDATATLLPTASPSVLAVTRAPEDSSPATKLRLRIEYDTTTVFGELKISGMEDAISVEIVEVVDGLGSADPGRISLELGGADEASMVVEVDIPQVDDRILTITSNNDPRGGSLVTIYLLPDEGDPILLQRLDHRWYYTNGLDSSSSTFVIQLGQLASQPASSIEPILSRGEVTCGQTILADATLTHDLSCQDGSQPAIVTGGSNITLDLGGNVLSGVPVSSENPSRGVFVNNVEGITIKNGTFQDFDEAVFAISSDHILLEDLTVRNLGVEDPMHNIVGFNIVWCNDLVIQDSLFEFNPILHRTAVGLSCRDAVVRNIEVQGGSVGVDLAFAQECSPDIYPNNVTIQNSSFKELSRGPVGTGFMVQCSHGARILDNLVTGAQVGIAGDAPYLGAVADLVVEGNTVQGNGRTDLKGIAFFGTTDSRIRNNNVTGFHFGILMGESYGCGMEDPYWVCTHSTNNLIENNVVIGNGIDLFHHELSRENSWGENTCETWEGIEIPECIAPSN